MNINASAIVDAFVTPFSRQPVLSHPSHAQPVTRVAAGRLTLTYNLDDLAASHAEVLGDGVLLEDAGELGLLEAVALEEGGLLLAAEDDVAGDEDVAGDVDEHVVLEEPLEAGPLREAGDLLLRRRRHGHVRDQHARPVVVVRAELAEPPHLLRAQRAVVQELHPDRADVRLRVRVRRRLCRHVLLQHVLAGAGREVELSASVGGREQGKLGNCDLRILLPPFLLFLPLSLSPSPSSFPPSRRGPTWRWVACLHDSTIGSAVFVSETFEGDIDLILCQLVALGRRKKEKRKGRVSS